MDLETKEQAQARPCRTLTWQTRFRILKWQGAALFLFLMLIHRYLRAMQTTLSLANTKKHLFKLTFLTGAKPASCTSTSPEKSRRPCKGTPSWMVRSSRSTMSSCHDSDGLIAIRRLSNSEGRLSLRWITKTGLSKRPSVAYADYWWLAQWKSARHKSALNRMLQLHKTACR